MESQSQPTQEANSTHCIRLVKYISLGIVLFVVGILIGGFTTHYLSSKSTNDAYQNGFNAAKKLVENSSLGTMLQIPNDTHSLAGTVTAINGHRLTVHFLSANPFADPSLASRTVLINASTTIVKVVQKGQKVFQAEMKAYVKATNAASQTTTPTTPPWQFKNVPVTVADIAVGDSIMVTSTQNIKTLKVFPASQIQINKKITTPINK